MLLLRPNDNLAVIEFTVKNFISLRQRGIMQTSGSNPDVDTRLTLDAKNRITQQGNAAFTFDRAGGAPVTLAFAVFGADPNEEYTAVDLIVQKTTADDDGGGVWDSRVVGNGPNANTVYVRNRGRPDHKPVITYSIYLLVRRVDAGADYPLGDIGVIDPLWTNR